MSTLPRVLIIAGSDSSGGAGIQADIKTATAFGAYAMTAITAVTVQDTLGVHGIHPIPPAMVRDQIARAIADIGADAIKIGMLGNAQMVETVAEALSAYGPSIPVVLDPVMIAKGGASLLDEDAVAAIKERLLPMARIVTPNIPEAIKLTGSDLASSEAVTQANETLFSFGAEAVLIKGGHGSGSTVTDLLAVRGEGLWVLKAARLRTQATHGTGCTLASAIACGFAEGMRLNDAVARAHRYVQAAIRSAPGFGVGHGPLNHMHAIAPYR
jgi:hydroxymethylpyrimidine/phosphomethylpyrimidine kinase